MADEMEDKMGSKSRGSANQCQTLNPAARLASRRRHIWVALCLSLPPSPGFHTPFSSTVTVPVLLHLVLSACLAHTCTCVAVQQAARYMPHPRPQNPFVFAGATSTASEGLERCAGHPLPNLATSVPLQKLRISNCHTCHLSRTKQLEHATHPMLSTYLVHV